MADGRFGEPREIEFDAARREVLGNLLRKEGIARLDSQRILPRQGAGPAPLSFAQERLWFLDQLQPADAVYNIRRAQRMKGQLDISALTDAVRQVVRRHEILRTTFPSADGAPSQHVAAAAELSIPLIDLRGFARKKREVEAARIAREEAAGGFNLTAGPLWRLRLLRMGKADHILLFTAHQIVFDGWSLGVFFREIQTFYDGFSQDRAVSLCDLPIQYADFAVWQRDELRAEIYGAQLTYWKNRLGGTLPVLELPADHARSAVQSFRGARQAIALSPTMITALKELSLRKGTTLFILLMTAFNTLLHRYAGQEDIIVGFPISQRSRLETQQLIGLCVNTLALRTDLSGRPTFSALLARVHAASLEAYAHQDLPFEKLVDELHQERDLSRNPLFQAMFTFQNILSPGLNLVGLVSEAMDLDIGTSKFDLTLSLGEENGRVVGFFEYSTDLFERSTIERMAGHLETLLDGIVADPEQPISALPLLRETERWQILVEWNDTDRAYSRGRCIHELFEAQSRRTPNAIAVQHAGQRLTYRELNRRANRLARHLRKLGVGPDKMVGVCLPRSPDMVVALLAILKAGGAYVPLDPAYPQERLRFMLDDAQVSVLVSEQNLIEDRSWGIEDGDSRRRIVYLHRDAAVIRGQSTANPKINIRPKNLAYVIYTSGSTGEPKGVAVEHRNAVAFLHWAKQIFSDDELAGVLASTSICFDLSVFELFAPLSCGGSVILIEDALALHELPGAEQVTLINAVPSAARELLDLGGLPPSVRTINLAGEPLSTELVRQIYETGGVKKVYDLYGPSETTTYSTFALRTAGGKANIGRPITNTKIYLLDDALQPVPVGARGEIFIAGAGVARGYLNRPQFTAEKFLRDPFASDPKARMYRTGDLARYDADGNIEYLGRVDQQVKIRGYRIELGEIETVLQCHPAVRECVVVARDEDSSDSLRGVNPKSKTCPEQSRRIENPRLDRQLVAYVVFQNSAPAVGAELRNFLRQKLPEYMAPSIFVPIEALPMTTNGKVDRRALPPPNPAAARLTENFTAPRTEIEELIAQVWREALKIERIAVHDNFFDLGGHSLLATRVAARLAANFTIELRLRRLFELPTIALLAPEVERLRGSRNPPTAPPLARAARDGRIPLSFAQRRLWFLHKRDGDLTAYNMPARHRVRGPLDVAALEEALNEIIQRHESLRTAIVEIDGEPVQRIAASAQLELPVVDLSIFSADEAEREIERLASEDACRPFDFTSPPLMRAKLVRLADDDHVLLLNFHHVVCDGSSWAIFYRELASLYEGAVSGKRTPLPALSTQYADFAIWERRWLESEAAAPQIDYWKRQLGSGLSPLDLPADYARPSAQSYRGARIVKPLSAELAGALKQLSRQEGATLFMTLLAALFILISRLLGQDNVVVGSTIAGRNRSGIEGLIGFFINALALRADLSGNPSFVELLKRVRETCLDAYAHQELPFERVVEEVSAERDGGRNPIFQVLFNMTDVSEHALKLAGCETTRISQAAPAAKFDLVVQAPIMGGSITLTFVYNADLFSEARMAVMLDQWHGLLSQVVVEPSKRIDEFSLVTEMAAAVLSDPTARLDDTWVGAIHEIVAHQAKARPKKNAVFDSRESWSYRELDDSSSRLANLLAQSGVKPSDVVSIYAHRDATLAVAILGALKAGAVFAMLDPAYPAARLIDYLRIARPKYFLRMADAGELPEDLSTFIGARGNLPLIDLPRDKKQIAGMLNAYPATAPVVSVDADSPAYIAFTSGSTGQPKGVLCRHGPITHFLPWQEETFELRESDRYSLFSGLGYNHLQRELFTALAAGATVSVPSSELLNDPTKLAEWLRREKISIVHLTPVLGRLLQTAKRNTLPAVRRIFFGGDLLTTQDILAARDLAPAAAMVSFFGATETQRAVGYFAVDRSPDSDAMRRETIPIGRGVKDTQIIVVNSNGRLVGIGELGEICVRSPHLAARYVGDDALTQANFVTNPFTGDKRDRLYRSGELGRCLPDGDVEWAGRRDRRVSIRGFRVELAEIELALSQRAGVRQAAIVAREFSNSDGGAVNETRLIAYVEREKGVALDGAALRQLLSTKLPRYMVPAYFHFMDRLPVSPNGKIDYPNLPVVESFATPCEIPVEAPGTELERKLSEIFATILGVKHVGRHESFFDLGGHSLLAAQAAARIGETLGVNLDVRAFLESPTVAGLARRIESVTSDDRPTRVKSRAREEIEI